jgi:hypothetical protein
MASKKAPSKPAAKKPNPFAKKGKDKSGKGKSKYDGMC